jgi:hypothetical protein
MRKVVARDVAAPQGSVFMLSKIKLYPETHPPQRLRPLRLAHDSVWGQFKKAVRDLGLID